MKKNYYRILSEEYGFGGKNFRIVRYVYGTFKEANRAVKAAFNPPETIKTFYEKLDSKEMFDLMMKEEPVGDVAGCIHEFRIELEELNSQVQKDFCK